MCPACKEVLVVLELSGVEIDRCTSCGGIWLDSGELEQILALAEVPAGRIAEALRAGSQGSRSRRQCVRCRRRMRQVAIEGCTGLVADRCPAGHGIWFDAGELSAAVKTLSGDQADAVAGFLADLLRYDLAAGPGR